MANKAIYSAGQFRSRNILNLIPVLIRFSIAKTEDKFSAFKLLFSSKFHNYDRKLCKFARLTYR